MNESVNVSTTNADTKIIENSPNNITSPNLSPHNKPSGAGSILGFLALILSLVAIAGVYYLYRNQVNENNDKTQLLAEVDKKISLKNSEIDVVKKEIDDNGAAINELKNLISENKKIIDEQKNQIDNKLINDKQELIDKTQKLAENNNMLSEKIQVLENQYESLYQAFSEIPSQKVLWRAIEVLQLQAQALRILEIEKNLPLAQVAIENSLLVLVKAKISNSEDYQKSTQAVLEDIRTQNQTSPQKIAAEIENLGEQINQLKIIFNSEISTSNVKATNHALPVKETWYNKLISELFGELKSLVKVYPENQALIPPGGEFFIRQNINLTIDTLRKAAMFRDSALYKSEFAKLLTWLDLYFVKSPNLDELKTQVQKLQSASLAIDSTKLKNLVAEGEIFVKKIGGDK